MSHSRAICFAILYHFLHFLRFAPSLSIVDTIMGSLFESTVDNGNDREIAENRLQRIRYEVSKKKEMKN